MFANVNISIDFFNYEKNIRFWKEMAPAKEILTVAKNVILQPIYNK